MKLCLLTCLILLSATVWTQNPQGKHFDTRNGLPSTEVYEVEFDQDRRIWFATDRGLCRYNGQEFEVFTTHEGLSNNTVLKMRRDREQRLWLSGFDGTLSYLKNGKIYPFPQNDTLLKYSPGDGLITYLFWDTSGNTYLRYNLLKSGVFMVLAPGPGGSASFQSFEDILQTHEEIKIGNRRFADLGDYWLPERDISELLVTDSVLYLVEYFKKLTIVNRSTGEESHFEVPDEILGLFDIGEGRLLVATRSGLYRFFTQEKRLDERVLFPGKAISDLAFDADGVCWITTLEDGVYAIASLEINFSGEEFLQTATVMAPLGDHLLIGTLEGEIWSLDTKGVYTRWVKNPLIVGRLSHAVREGDRMVIGKYLFYSENGGLRMDSVGDLGSERVGQPLSGGRFLLGGYGGFQVFRSQPFDLLFSPEEKGFLRRIWTSLSIDKRVWLGTLHGIFELQEPDFATPQKLFKDNPRLDVRINHLCKDRQGNIWISTMGNGLFCYHEDSLYHLEKGLNSPLINQSFSESDSVLWVAGNRGLNRLKYNFDGGKLEVRELSALTVEDGLPDNFIRAVTFWQEELWVSGQQGMVHFNPADLIKETIAPPAILIEEVLVDTQKVDYKEAYDLSYDQNDISLRFVGISEYPPINQPFYRYRLLGSQDRWVFTNDRQVALYDLPPGEYRFEVEARNRNGEWSEKTATFSFEIHPHISQTLAFRLGMGLLLLLAVMALFWLRMRRLKKRNQQERELQKAKLRTQEAELTVLRNQMNPHFVFNALNAIQGYIFDQDEEQANHYLGRFSRLMRNALQFSRCDRISLKEELSFLETYLELEGVRFPDVFSWNIEVDRDVEKEHVFLPPFLLQPLLENAIKHGFKEIDYPGLLDIRFEKGKAGGLLIWVKDNGIGLKQQHHPKPGYYKSMGLEIVRNRIALLKDAGAEASFDLLDRSLTSQKGTEARIFLPAQVLKNMEKTQND